MVESGQIQGDIEKHVAVLDFWESITAGLLSKLDARREASSERGTEDRGGDRAASASSLIRLSVGDCSSALSNF